MIIDCRISSFKCINFIFTLGSIFNFSISTPDNSDTETLLLLLGNTQSLT